MQVIILAAGQGTRLKPMTDHCPKCMVEVGGKALIDRQLDTLHACGISDERITIITGFCGDALQEKFDGSSFHFIQNHAFETTNMVCSLMCAKELIRETEDLIISYGDIIYTPQVLHTLLKSEEDISVVVDDGWHGYWSRRCENPLDDAESLMFDAKDYLTQIGQKAKSLAEVQSQYIGLMRFKGQGVKELLNIAEEAYRRTVQGESLWRTTRNYQKMYMTDLLQGLIDEGKKLKAVHINRGWYEVDNIEDLKLAETELEAGDRCISGQRQKH